MKKKLFKLISVVLCILVMSGSITTAYGNDQIDNKPDAQPTEPINENDSFYSLENNGSFPDGKTNPNKTDTDPKVSFFFAFLRDKPSLSSSKILDILVLGSKIKVLGYSGIYTYVEDVDTQQKGYIFYLLLDDKFDFNRNYDHVYTGQTNSGRLKIINGVNVEWTVNPSGYISIDQETKIITGIKPGSVTVTAKSGMRRISCTVTCINPWKEQETATAEKDVEVFPNDNNSVENIGTISKGTVIAAKGDLADGSGWIYVNSGSLWGFIKLSDFPGIDYLLTEYHYYDQGYNIRFGSAESKIYDYASVLNDVMMANFKLKVCPYVDSYTSLTDNCKILSYGEVNKNNLSKSCPQTGNHHKNSCLVATHVRDDMLSYKHNGSPTVTKCIWTGHIMNSHKGDRSHSESTTQSIIFTTGNTVYSDSYTNKSNNSVKNLSLYEIVHETSHQLSANDHYCYGKDGSGLCKNPNCIICFGNGILPECIMGKVIYPTDTYNLFCEECETKIKNHTEDHH